jgi:two-component system sensor histidine kinase BaeS
VNRRFRFGIRAKLIVALVGIALLTADMTTLYSSLGLSSRIEAAAKARLVNSARHFSDVSATVYSQNGGWTPSAITTLGHLAEIDELRLTLVTIAGTTIVPTSSGSGAGPTATANVVVAGTRVAELTIEPVNGQILNPEELQLRRELAHLHLVAGVIAAAIALVIALYVALTMSRPLRRIRATAEEIESGRLEARVDLRGDDEIRAVGRALNSLAETLQREEQLRKENLADLAHELRTPVMGLLGRIEAAQDGVLADGAANLDSMHSEALRLSRLLNDLSALADAERPSMLLETTAVDLAHVVAAPAAEFAERFDQRDIAFTSQLVSVPVIGDSGRLEQIVVNLLANALRYTEPGGEVRLRVGPDPRGALIEVNDNGIGIPAADIPHLFTRFWRGEKSRSRDTGGAGIGLAIVDELVRAHRGVVEVESKPGSGSTFRVVLPLASPRLH